MRPSPSPFGLLLVTLLVCVVVPGHAQTPPAYDPKNDTLVYVGTYTRQKSKGIYCYRLQTRNNEVAQNITLVPLGLAAEAVNPSFLAVDHARRLLFCVNETNEFAGQPGGAVSAYAIEPATGQLRLINQRPTRGTGPCHLALDKTGRHLVVSNYGGGSVTVVPVAADGTLGEPSDFVQHAGSSVHPQRQQGPHAHGATFSTDNRFVYICDLGLDRVLAYKFDAATGKLTPADPAFTALAPGSGPRHLVFRPDGKFAYVINELTSTVTAFAHDAATGALKEIQTVTTLPGYYDGPNTTAEIDVHPSGKWLYASNRGNETVVLFNIDAATGTLTYTEEQNTGGKKPRHFGIEPSAKHLVIANQDSDTLLVCRIDAGNGRLKPSGVFAEAPSPVCAVFVAPTGPATPAVRIPGEDP